MNIEDPISFEHGPLKIGAAAAANRKATETAIMIMQTGGNAVDAAIAAGHVMGVVEPLDCGLAAGGFMAIYCSSKNKTEVIDFLGTAPASAKYELYAINDINGDYTIRVEGQHNQIGYRSIATPGTLRGFEEAHKKYGALPMHELMAPAISIAKEGFPISYKGALRMARTAHILATTDACRNLYLKSDNSAPREGEIIQNKDYAYTLEEIAKYGADTFYSGDLARFIVNEIDKNYGFLTKDDLLKYKAIWRKPSHFNYNGLDILTPPPPSSGSLVFSGLEALTLDNKSHSAHQLLAEAMLKMFSKRRRNFGDPAFTSTETVSESPETTSLCTIDSGGNAACLTYSNNNHSGVVIPDTGILMNNSMALFSPWPDNPNAVVGGKRPISSMMPTLLFKNGKIKMAIGASGSTRIPTSLMQVLYRLTVEKKSIQTAISEPKLHAEAEIMMSDEDLLYVAKPLAQQMGLKYVISPGRDTSMGVVQAIHIDQENITTAIGDTRAKACGMVL